jgi:alkaline phosphatase D
MLSIPGRCHGPAEEPIPQRLGAAVASNVFALAPISTLGQAGCSDDGGSSDRVSRTPGSSAQVFMHGVGSGRPALGSRHALTRATPRGEQAVSVNWVLSASTDMTDILRSYTATPDAARDYMVKVDGAGLEAGTTYS